MSGATILPAEVRAAIIVYAFACFILVLLWQDFGIKFWHYFPEPVHRHLWADRYLWEAGYPLGLGVFLGTDSASTRPVAAG